MASLFPPARPKLPVITTDAEVRDYLTRLVSALNDYEDHDISFTAGATATAARHNLSRVPASFEVLWVDADVSVYADTASGWGYNVVYFQATAACNARVRLR